MAKSRKGIVSHIALGEGAIFNAEKTVLEQTALLILQQLLQVEKKLLTHYNLGAISKDHIPNRGKTANLFMD